MKITPFWRGVIVSVLAFSVFVSSCPAFPNRGAWVGDHLYLRCQ